MPWNPRKMEEYGWKFLKYKNGCKVQFELSTMELIVSEFNEIISPKVNSKRLIHILALVRKFEKILNGESLHKS